MLFCFCPKRPRNYFFVDTIPKDYQQINFNDKIRNFVELIEERNEVGRIISGSGSRNLTLESFLEDQRFAGLKNLTILI